MVLPHPAPDRQTFEPLRGIERLLAVVARLRHPENGCPWDLQQDHKSLKPYLLEEAYETLEAIDRGSDAELKEELGDLLLQIALHARLAEERGGFDFSAVAETIADKLIRRHPHVFGDVEVRDVAEVTRNWEVIKALEKSEKAKSEKAKSEKAAESTGASILDPVSRGLPALLRATELSRRAVDAGFKWPDSDSLWACVMSEFDEFRAETGAPGSDRADRERLEEEMGDIFFATVSLANHYGVDPETALARANAKFMARFRRMEALAEKPLAALTFEEWDALWNKAKQGSYTRSG